MALRKKHHVGSDIAGILASIAFTVILWRAGILLDIVQGLDGFSYLGIFIAGMFFTSIFTTAPAIVILAVLAREHGAFTVALLGGLGAMLIDFVIFHIVKKKASNDFKSLIRHKKIRRFSAIFRTRLFRWFVPFLGALVIASPLPDELGVALLGASNIDKKYFLAISYIFNTLGILAIGLIAIRAAG